MRAVTCTQTRLEVEEVPDPVPAEGQVLVEVIRAGICGSDLHARLHADELAEVTARVGYDGIMRSDQSVVLGHEFSGRILEYGPGTRRKQPPGSVVVAMPLLRQDGQVHATGLSPHAPGAYAERLLVQESLTFPVPNGFSPELAALTEPMAVGLHAVRRGQVGRKRVAVVIGCGPIGLAVIGMLKATGVRHVVASDFSPGRRELARRYGADVVVDPAVESPFASASEHGHLTEADEVFDMAVDGMDKLRRLPRWWHVYRAAEALGATQPAGPVVFECVGVPGMIQRVVDEAPISSRIVVVGVCMEADRIQPVMAVNKEIELRFVLGYTPLDFHDALHLLAEGKVDPGTVVTGTVGLPGVAAAFEALGDPEAQAKILIDPASVATEPV